MKYLFSAIFQDGSFIDQTEQDVSTQNPDKSAFFDVLEKEKQIPLVKFGIVDKAQTTCLMVNLEDGSFFVNGATVKLHNQDVPLSNRRLIYFRRNELMFDIGARDPSQTTVTFFVGWQANDSQGNNVQHVMSLQ